MTDALLRDQFGYKPTDCSQDKARVAIRTGFFHLAKLVFANTPPSRAQTMAMDDLVRACRGAIAAVVAHVPVDDASLPPRVG